MADDSDEDDYMSDIFVCESNNVKPGLPKIDSLSRKQKIDTKHQEDNDRNKVKPMKVREQESRDEGMSKALDNTNIGFALLQKMGYRQGTGLGKEGMVCTDLTTNVSWTKIDVFGILLSVSQFVFAYFIVCLRRVLILFISGTGRAEPIPIAVKAGEDGEQFDRDETLCCHYFS